MQTKLETIYVNVSSSFLARTRCPKCHGKPHYYYAIRLPERWKDHTYLKDDFAISLKWYGRPSNDWYMEEQPRYFHSAHDFDYAVENKGYNPILHRTRGSNISNRDNVMEVISCWCGSTAWAFNQKAAKNRPEITNRKSRLFYPNKFEY